MVFSERSPSAEAQRPADLSFGVYIPQHILTNERFERARIQTSSGNILTAEDIASRTGVLERRIEQYKTAEDMAELATRFLRMRQPGPVDAIYFSTSYPTGIDSATEINRRLHLGATETHNFHTACSGFAEIMAHIYDHRDQLDGKTVLAETAELYSPTVEDLLENGGEFDPSFAQTIFGDGAYVTRIVVNRNMTPRAVVRHTFSEEVIDFIKMPIDPSKVHGNATVVPVPYAPKFRQNGRGVYEAIRNGVPPLVYQAIEEAGLTPSDIAYVFPHQGSRHIVTALQKQMKDLSVFEDYEKGNLSSASIPKSLERAIKEDKLHRGDKAVLAGFGAGGIAVVVVVEF